LSTINLYWPVYKNLEKELLKIANSIHLADDQVNVYSMHIADLIVRCSIEIEAISKELYSYVGGNMSPIDVNGKMRDLYFDTDCLDLLEQKWALSKKQVIVSATNFYLSDKNNIVLTPLYKANKRGSSGSKWKQVYQTLKHNRKNSLKEAQVKYLLHSMGALYILNIYYKDEVFDLKDDGNAINFPMGLGSEMFSVKIHKVGGYNIEGCHIKPDFDECIYLIKFTDEYFDKFKEGMKKLDQNMNEAFIKHPKFLEYLQLNGTEALKNYQGNFFWNVLGEKEYVNVLKSTTKDTKFFDETKYEAIVNKGKIH